MSLLFDTWSYVLANQADFWAKTGVHLRLSGTALLIGIVAGALLGAWVAHSATASPWVTGTIGALRSVPSLAIMAAMLPLIGIGFLPAVVALTILAIPPVLLNTQAGFSAVDPAIIEAARGMGMDARQIVWQIELPLALPVILAGIRIAAVEVLASATIGAIIGAGGLGEYIFAGLSLGPAYIHLMLVGAITVALLTLGAEILLNRLEAMARRAYHR